MVVVEYSSPNTNKPLHLGHIRNNLLGFSLSRILSNSGNRVIRTNIVNDRGIHICKSMLAWSKFGEGETPQTSGLKGDHLVGKYYVLFEKKYKEQIEKLKADGLSEEEAKNSAALIKEAREMLLKWEAGDPKTREIWQLMNGWVYDGFATTYKRLGVEFDSVYYESDTYQEGRKIALDAVEKGILTKREDNSVWADLTKEGLDEKLLLRSDGTAVYMTQDLGTAVQRYNDTLFDRHIYVVGNEQNYHFQVLALILKKMGYEWADGLHHFSYGMVELPEGRMKSREGTVVDADDLISEMEDTAKSMSEELGKLHDFSDEEKNDIYRIIGLGALKYYILKVDPKKTMTFNPVESVDFNGNTGPFIQYAATRIKSVIRKASETDIAKASWSHDKITAEKAEIALIRRVLRFPGIVSEAGKELSPALIANYCYDLAREFNQFYHEYSILSADSDEIKAFRVDLTAITGATLVNGLFLLGIEVPEKM